MDEAAELFTIGFVEVNSVWKKLGATFNQVHSVNRGRLISCAKNGWVCAMINSNDNSILGITGSQDLLDYWYGTTMPHNC